MSRREHPSSGPEIYHRTLYPRVPSDGWGRFMHATTAHRVARELWQIREGAKKAVIEETRAPWPVRHLCVLVEHPFRGDPEDDVQHDLLHEVLCLACTWLTSASSAEEAVDRARAHAQERALSPEEAVNALDVQFRVWQAGDGRPCVIERGEGRHHARGIRDLDAGGDFAECTTCEWRAGPFPRRWDADIAAKNHVWTNGGAAARDANSLPTRGTPCPRPFPPPIRSLRATR